MEPGKHRDDETIINVNLSLIMNFFAASVVSFVNFVKDNPDNVEENLEVAFRMWWKSIINI